MPRIPVPASVALGAVALVVCVSAVLVVAAPNDGDRTSRSPSQPALSATTSPQAPTAPASAPPSQPVPSSTSIPAAANTDWSDDPAVSFVVREASRLLAAAPGRWLLQRQSPSDVDWMAAQIYGEGGALIGQPFAIPTRGTGCARTGTGVLACQVHHDLMRVDLTSGVLTPLVTVADPRLGITPLPDGWVTGVSQQGQKIVGSDGRVRWQAPVGASVSAMPDSSLVRLTGAGMRTQVRRASDGGAIFSCDCEIQLLPEGFVTATGDAFHPLHTRYDASGTAVEPPSSTVRYLAAGAATVKVELRGAGDASRQRVTVTRVNGPRSGAVLWDGEDDNFGPSVCGSWLLTFHGLIDAATGRIYPTTPPGAGKGSACSGFNDRVAVTDSVVAASGHVFRPVAGSLQLVDDALVGTNLNNTVLVYARPPRRAGPQWVESSPRPVWDTTNRLPTDVGPGQLTAHSSVAGGRWLVSPIYNMYQPASTTAVLNDQGQLVATAKVTNCVVPPGERVAHCQQGTGWRGLDLRTGHVGGPVTAPPPLSTDPAVCGPYRVTLAADAQSVAIRRGNHTVHRPDPGHIMSSGEFRCAGYTDRVVAYANSVSRRDGGLVVIPLDPDAPAQLLHGPDKLIDGFPVSDGSLFPRFN